MILPILILVSWTLVMWVWMYATRIPAMQKAKIRPQAAANKGSLDMLPSKVRQVADNYNHLHEQPTVFYALALAIQVGGLTDPLYVALGYAYVVSRVLHSLVQSTVNVVVARFALFVLGSLILGVMVVRALLHVTT